MPQKIDLAEIERKVLGFFQRLTHVVSTFFKSLATTIVNYIRGKTRHIPEKLPKGRREMIESILEHEDHQNFLQSFAQECGMSLEQVEQTFRGYLKEIASDLNYLTMPFWDFFLTWIFDTIYEGIEVDTRSLDRLRAYQGKFPVVFVPNHRSHMDYLLLSLSLHQHSITVPYICAGSNLSFWPLGSMFRKSGAFFIRRSYEGNRLYAAAVHAYLEELIREKSCMEFFIEGSRSRTGKLLPPRMGILKSIVQAYDKGAAEDVIFVPTSFTYDSVLEEKSYVDEQAGAAKKDENFWDLLRLRKYLSRRKGKVYVEFGDPISLKDYSCRAAGADAKERVAQLASQITYGINKSAVVTPASLSAMVLLNQTTRAIEEATVGKDVELYLQYLRMKGCRLSEPLQKYQATSIRESLKNYVRSHLLEEYRDQDQSLYRIVEEKRPLLDYYKNTSIHFFVSLGVVAAVLNSTSETALPLKRVEEDFLFIRAMFALEFTFSRRQSLQNHLEKVLEFLSQKGLVRLEGETLHKVGGDLSFYARPLQNFMEGYRILWRSLPELGKRRLEIRDLLKFLRDRGRILYLREEIVRPESVNKFTFQNGIACLRDHGLLREEVEGWGKRKKTYYCVLDLDQEFGRKLSRALGETGQ